MEFKNQKIAIIYHCKDMDGLLSATLLKNYLSENNELTFVPYNYEKEGLKFIEHQKTFVDIFDTIIFVDVTPTLDWLMEYNKLDNDNKNLIIIDHHTDAIKMILEMLSFDNDLFETTDINDFPKIIKEKYNSYLENKYINSFSFAGNLNNNIYLFVSLKVFEHFQMTSASMLSKYFIDYVSHDNFTDNIHLNKMNKLVAEYDVYNFNEENYPKSKKLEILHFQYGINSIIKELIIENKYDEIIEYINSFKDIKSIYDIINIGEEIFDEKMKIESNKRNYLLIEGNESYENNKFILIFGEYPDYISQEYLKQKFVDENISALVYIEFDTENNLIKISVRQGHDKTFDCIKFVKQLTDGNGGGHFAATGGAIQISEFTDMLSTNFK